MVNIPIPVLVEHQDCAGFLVNPDMVIQTFQDVVELATVIGVGVDS
jgi:hypothetical protein